MPPPQTVPETEEEGTHPTLPKGQDYKQRPAQATLGSPQATPRLLGVSPQTWGDPRAS